MRVAYRANAYYWTSQTDYHEAALGTLSAADDLDLTGAWSQQVANAWIAVGVSVPNPSISFSYPDGIPSVVEAGRDTTFEVVVSGVSGGSPVASSGHLYYSIDGGAYVDVDMPEPTRDHYSATLPGIGCGSTIEFYFSAVEMSSGTKTDPGNAPTDVYSAFPATSTAIVFDDNFETDKGWSVSGDATDGQWDRGTPVGGGDRGDPPTDFDGSGSCYLTDNVDDNSDVDGGTTILTSPSFDLSTGDGLVHYARWYSNTAGAEPNDDIFVVYVSSNNGTNWTEVETVGPVEQASGEWYEHSFMVSDFVTPSSQVRIRFDASDLGAGSVIEAGVDDVQVTVFECSAMVDTDGDGIYDHNDNCVNVYNPNQDDADGDDIGDSCDVCTDTDDDGYGNPGYPENTCDLDNCPSVSNPLQQDADSDGIGDACDECTDTDGDGFGNPGYAANTCPVDNCPDKYNPSQEDVDSDGIGDSCDTCIDFDGDGYGDPGYPANTCELDNCPSIANPDQTDADGDGIGDSCDVCTDLDDDGYGDPGYPANTCELDNCPSISNPDQLDADDDGIGDLCDDCPDDPDDNCCDPQFSNNAPQITSDGLIELEPGEELLYTVAASDPDCDGSELIISAMDLPSWCSFDGSVVSGTIECDYADTSFTVTVNDGTLADTQLVTIDIDQTNVAPVIDQEDDVSMRDGEEYTFYPSITDPDDSDHTIIYLDYPVWCSIQDDSIVGTAPEEYLTESIVVVVEDFCKSDTMSFEIVSYICGDANVSNYIDIDDAVYIVNYIFAGGPEPTVYASGDADCSGYIDIDDVVYIINYIFGGGPIPCDGC